MQACIILRGMRKKILTHTVGWVLVFFFWYSIYFFLEPTAFVTLSVVGLCTLFSMIAFYATSYFFVPKFLYTKRYVALVLGYLHFLVVAGSLFAYSEYAVYENLMGHLNWNYVKLVYNCYIQLIYISAIAGAIRFFGDQYKTRRHLDQVEKENIRNELKFLKAQMNPHFLFNSLNTIYVQIPKESEGARNTLLTFSDLLRYQLYECNVEQVSIYKEISYIESFVELQRQRKNASYEFSLDCCGIKNDFLIAPLILIGFVENAIKHVSHHKDRKNTVHIQLSNDDKTFFVKIRNSKDGFPMKEINGHGGIGLNNVKRRLELLYPGKHQLDLTETENYYLTELRLQL
jgi:two-component system, LytTR family, sensor kinase